MCDDKELKCCENCAFKEISIHRYPCNSCNICNGEEDMFVVVYE